MHPRQIKAAFDRGENITQLLRDKSNSDVNTEQIIETAYDLQTGDYVDALKNDSYRCHKEEYGRAIADEIAPFLGPGGSILEPGIGEGTTLSFVMDALQPREPICHGFDISWSRIGKCQQWLEAQGHNDVFLSVASIFHAPYRDNSFDVVYTSHAIEPNGGSEIAILKELYRVCSRFLVLLEPGFELADADAQDRMIRLGYVRGLCDHAAALGMNVVKHELFAHTANPQNPTAITVIEKDPCAVQAVPGLACPQYGDRLSDFVDSFFSADSLRAYPRIQGIPCLRREDAVIASHYESIGRTEQEKVRH